METVLHPTIRFGELVLIDYVIVYLNSLQELTLHLDAISGAKCSFAPEKV